MKLKIIEDDTYELVIRKVKKFVDDEILRERDIDGNIYRHTTKDGKVKYTSVLYYDERRG